MTNTNLDLLIIGGGINGCGIAADAAGRGLSVTLCEQNDLASATSSSSSKLIHGGLRYLEYYEFALVRKALKEREVLLKKAPHIIWPLQFVMPHDKHLRPAWLIRLGLFLYDHLGGRKRLPKSHGINFKGHAAGKIIKDNFDKGFMYSDCWVDDARLVVLNAMAAKEKGATILPRTKLISAKRGKDHWEATVKNQFTGETEILRAKILINAAGPWVEDIIKDKLSLDSNNHITLIQGSHIVVPRLYPDDFAFILQNTDKRIVFVIPFQDKYSLIGTTDTPLNNQLKKPILTQAETDYLLKLVNSYFRKSISEKDIVWHYSGIRALKKDNSNDPSAITRDYELELNQQGELAPLLSVFGGKITTYRILAENTLEKLRKFFPHCQSAWTANAVLPGGNIPNADFDSYFNHFYQQHSWLPIALAHRYVRTYGTFSEKIISNAKLLEDLGQHFGHGLYQAEIRYLQENEWAKTAEDILWRRTKLGLLFTPEEIAKLKNILNNTE